MPRPAATVPFHAAWWLWLLGQAGVLAMYCGRISLAGGYPKPVEATADLGLAVTQMGLAALLAPALLGDIGRFWRAASVAVVFTVLAGRLAGRSAVDVAQLFTVVLLWLIAIARIGRHSLGQLAIVFLTVAIPVLWYAGAEYRDPPLPATGWAWLASPTLGVCTTRLHNALIGPAIWPAAGIWVESMACRAFGRRRLMVPHQPIIEET